MKYIEGIDYWIRFIEFPNMASESVVASHGDGTFTIYVNTLFSPDVQQERLMHELEHLENEHFYRDDLTITQIESQADGMEPAADIRTLPGDAPQFSVFRSSALPEWASFGFYVPDDSMRPFFKRDQLLYCDDYQLRPGDVGLFQYRGTTMLRQYNTDPLGMTYLFTLGRKRDSLLLRPADLRDLICMGRVHVDQLIPLPGK